MMTWAAKTACVASALLCTDVRAASFVDVAPVQ